MLLQPLLDYRPALTAGEGIGRYVRELTRALAELPGVDLGLFGPTWARPMGDAFAPRNARLFRKRIPSKLLTGALRLSPFGVEHLVPGPVDVVHHTQYRRLPTRRPEVATIHDLVYLDSDRFVCRETSARMSAFARATAKTARVIVTPSHAVADEVAERLDFPRERIVAAHLGVDHGGGGPASPAPLDGGPAPLDRRPYLFTVARLEKRKNLDGTLAAFEALGESGLDWVVAGPDGEGASAFRDLVERSPQKHRIQLLGRVSEAKLQSLLVGCAAFILVPHDEGFGMAPLEAAAAGRPVVTSDVPVVAEVCSGIAHLAGPTEPLQIAAAIRAALSEPDGPTEREGRRSAALRFTWTKTAALHCDAYRMALGE